MRLGANLRVRLCTENRVTKSCNVKAFLLTARVMQLLNIPEALSFHPEAIRPSPATLHSRHADISSESRDLACRAGGDQGANLPLRITRGSSLLPITSLLHPFSRAVSTSPINAALRSSLFQFAPRRKTAPPKTAILKSVPGAHWLTARDGVPPTRPIASILSNRRYVGPSHQSNVTAIHCDEARRWLASGDAWQRVEARGAV